MITCLDWDRFSGGEGEGDYGDEFEEVSGGEEVVE